MLWNNLTSLSWEMIIHILCLLFLYWFVGLCHFDLY